MVEERIVAMTAPRDEPKPGDEVPPDSKQSAESICPRCGGTGQSAGNRCPQCEGTGTITVTVGDA
jgi:predicted amidophosphoribosyltransferase